MSSDETKDVGEQLQEKIGDLIAEAGSLGKNDKASPKQLAMLVKEAGTILRTIVDFTAKHAAYVEETFDDYDERIGAMEDEETRIAADDAQKIIEHLLATNDLIRKLIESTPAAAPGRDQLETLLGNGELLVEVIKEHTVEAEDDDDEDDDDEDEDDDEPKRH